MEITQERESSVPPDWVSHPHTRKVVRQFQEELTQARRTLTSVARKSPDAEVREASTQIVQLERFISQLTGMVGEAGQQ